MNQVSVFPLCVASCICHAVAEHSLLTTFFRHFDLIN